MHITLTLEQKQWIERAVKALRREGDKYDSLGVFRVSEGFYDRADAIELAYARVDLGSESVLEADPKDVATLKPFLSDKIFPQIS